MLLFRQLFDPHSSTYSYLLGDPRSREAILIDPVFEQARRDAALVEELDFKLRATLETHVHADHVTGAWLLKRRFGSKIALCAQTGAEGKDFGGKYNDVIAGPGGVVATLLTGDVVQLDANSLDPVGAPFPASRGDENDMAFSADGRRVMQIGTLGVRLYDVASRTQLAERLA